jgi:hypothetical protein
MGYVLSVNGFPSDGRAVNDRRGIHHSNRGVQVYNCPHFGIRTEIPTKRRG